MQNLSVASNDGPKGQDMSPPAQQTPWGGMPWGQWMPRGPWMMAALGAQLQPRGSPYTWLGMTQPPPTGGLGITQPPPVGGSGSQSPHYPPNE